ncbi:hypothetical protein FRC18_009748 [Serendipita sp. 400]|nr:hypothetical protein FRC18_009748 [Serendipita sp. 400]
MYNHRSPDLPPIIRHLDPDHPKTMSQEESTVHENIAEESKTTDDARNAIADAILRRAEAPTVDEDEERRFARERETRLEFRRLVDPGIARGNTPARFEETLKVLSKIADNLLSDIGNEKYRRFKPTNNLIKKHLVEVKGALEYAVALGFRAEVEHFQPYYTFLDTPKNRDNLRIGASVLTETLERIIQKAEHEKLNRVDPKAVQREIAQKVKMAYEDDRKEKKRRDDIERQAREARARVTASTPIKKGNKTTETDDTSVAASPSPDVGNTSVQEEHKEEVQDE